MRRVLVTLSHPSRLPEISLQISVGTGNLCFISLKTNQCATQPFRDPSLQFEIERHF